MKQNIIWSQFIELNFEQVNKLQKLIDQRYHLVKDAEHWETIKNHKYIMEDGEVFRIHTSYTGFLDKTNIGKMIEILDNSKYTYDIKRTNKYNNWVLLEMEEHKDDKTLKDRDVMDRYDGKELCDVLWDAVKSMLSE